MPPFFLTKRHLWGLAAGGPLAAWHDESFQKLSSRYSRDKCLQILAQWWSTQSREDALARLRWLIEAGHTQGAVALAQSLSLNESSHCENPDGRTEYVRKHKAEIMRSGLRAWDLGRLVSVARWSCAGGLITEAEAWGYILGAIPSLREAYDSWETFGQGWMVGYRYWHYGNADEPGFVGKLEWLSKRQ